MFILATSRILLTGIILLLLNACSSLNGPVSSTQANSWETAPKSYIAALKAAKQGQSQQAIELFKQTIQSYPDFSPAYTNLGLQQLQLKKSGEARNSLTKAITINPQNPVALQHLGVIARLQGDFDSARKFYKKSLQLNPDYSLAHLNLGILLDLYLYDFEQALEHYQRYQSLQKQKDKNVSKWIIDLKRRIARNKKS